MARPEPARTSLVRLLTYARIAGAMLAWAALALIWLAWLAEVVQNMRPRLAHISPAGMRIADAPCGTPQCDFSVFWPAGLLARSGAFQTLYLPAPFHAFRQHLFYADIDPLSWFYPPTALLAVAPASFLPFEASFYAWTAALIALGMAVLRLSCLPWLVITAAMLSPAALWNDELGQFGVLTGSLLWYTLSAMERSPKSAGAVLATLLIKPQAALLAPVAMLAARRWRAIAASAAAGAALLGLTLLAFGWGAWTAYLADGLKLSRAVIDVPPPQANYERFGLSVFWMLRSFGAPLTLSYTAQAIAALLSCALVWRLWQNGAGTLTERAALTVFLSLLATPYGYADDMVGWSIALAALACARNWRIDLLDALFWTWPCLCEPVFSWTGHVLTPVVVALAVARSWQRKESASFLKKRSKKLLLTGG
jgi:hypothetical protein